MVQGRRSEVEEEVSSDALESNEMFPIVMMSMMIPWLCVMSLSQPSGAGGRGQGEMPTTNYTGDTD